MRVALIKPAIGRRPDRQGGERRCMEPLELAALAGVTPPWADVELFDDRLLPPPLDLRPDLAGITVDTFTARRAYALADRLRARGVPVVLGGPHPTVLPEEAAEHADSVVVGEAEDLWPRALEDARSGRLAKVYRAEAPPSLAGRLARRDIFKGKGYPFPPLVEFGRGCRSRCSFCTIASIHKGSYRHRPVEEVVDEIRGLGVRSVLFADDNIAADPAAAKELFRALLPLGIRWASQSSIQPAGDPELLDLMARSGCWGLFIGFESLSPVNLSRMRKEGNLRPGPYEASVRALRRRGIRVWASFMLGWDGDGPEAVEETLRFALEQRFFLANFNNLVPLPGTPLYDGLRAEGRLLYDRWWLDDRFRFGGPAFRPARFSPDGLCEACYRARLRFGSWKSLLRRGADFEANVRGLRGAAELLLANWVFTREVRRKQGMVLGLGRDDKDSGNGLGNGKARNT